MLLLNYAKERDITLDIDNITLIEPSSLALSRALLHIDVLKQKNYNVKAINSDLDCLNKNNLQTQSTNKTLHFFSNTSKVAEFVSAVTSGALFIIPAFSKAIFSIVFPSFSV
jgi:hypothetical protein